MLKMKFLTLCVLILTTHSAAESINYIGGDHYNPRSNKFFNPKIPKFDKGLWDVLKWLASRDQADWPKWVENEAEPKLPSTLSDHEMALTFINHSSFLIQFNGINILTDPIYSERTSPVSWAGPKRVRAPGLPFNRLPKIDIVTISHNHYDHLDIETLLKLNKKFKPKFIVPMGDKKLLNDIGIKNVEELDWWTSTNYLGDKLKITFTPAQHFSGRGIFDRMRSLWGGYVFRFNGYQVFFAGDTGYASHFKEIKYRFEHIDFALIPIGAYKPRWFMKPMHVNPNEAVKAHIDLGSKKSIGMHFGTFQLSDEAIYKPVEDLQRAKTEYGIKPNDFNIMSVGETLQHAFGL